MINPQELDKILTIISYDILDEIISPICDIPKGTIGADIYLADIGCYTWGDEPEENAIYEAITKRYAIDNDTFEILTSYQPIAYIALLIYLNSPKFKEAK